MAVLVEPGMVVYGGTPALPPARMVAALRERGVSVEPISAAQAADPSLLVPSRYAVVVLPYGNAFPAPAFPALRAYHAAGGSLVMSGVPFCHPCERQDGRWRDLGHDPTRFRHDAAGIGTGGFGGPAEGVDRLEAARANPLGLANRHLARRRAALQWLDTETLDPRDEVLPLVLLRGPSGPPRVAAAAIRHRCDMFSGARNVWIGQVASGHEAADRWAAEQLVVRGVLWCLHDKGLLDAAAFRSRLAAVDRIRRPAPPPSALTYRPSPRPWGEETFVPKSAPPARRLLAVEVGELPAEVRIALTSLQALTSRRQPVLWLLRTHEDRFWLDWHQERGHIDGYEIVEDWRGLFRRFADDFRGAVIPDDALYRGGLLAVNVAACEDLIVATPALAAELGLQVRVDLRGRFATYADGLRWTREQYGNRLNRHLSDFMHPARLANGNFAYAMQWRAPVFWIAGPVDSVEPGADPVAEREEIARMMAGMAPNVAMLGFPYFGEGVGPGEVGGVELGSRYGQGLVCTDFLGNVSVTSGVRVESFRQHEPPPPPPLERDKVYIALAMSDGDNQNTWLGFFRRYFEHPAFGTFPLAFGMGPPIAELQPAIAEWYYQRAGPLTEFIADVSGVAYIQPENYALAYRRPERVLDGFLEWTARSMRTMDMRTVRTVGGGDDLLAAYARKLPFCHSLFADMGRYSGREGIDNLTYTLPGGMPVFRAVTSWRYGREGFLREVREQVGTRRPAFVNGFVHCWTFTMDDLARIVRERDPDMVFVTPSQLAALYRQAMASSTGEGTGGRTANERPAAARTLGQAGP
ncbi:MAG TPA: hypothetical protein VLH79_04595 [Chthonomonadales bacterium]|nr:hypothetical protein [Chthonomonadales bacterium]